MSILVPGSQPHRLGIAETLAIMQQSDMQRLPDATGSDRRAARRREQREQQRADEQAKQRPSAPPADPAKELNAALSAGEIRRFKRLAHRIRDERELLVIYANTEPEGRAALLRDVAPHLRFTLSPGVQRMVDGYAEAEEDEN